jgi:hypothetical protein
LNRLTNRTPRWTPLLVTTGIIRAAIIVMGILLFVFGVNETIRLFGVLAVVFGALRLYLLLRSNSRDEEAQDDTP